MKTMQEGMSLLKLFTASILMLVVSSCNIYRYVPEKDHLFIGSKITFDKKNKDATEIKSTLLSRTWSLPNKKIAFVTD